MSTGLYKKCRICGNLVEVLILGGGELSCCGEPLTFMRQGRAEDQRDDAEPPLELIEITGGDQPRWEFLGSAAPCPAGGRPPA